MFVTCSLCRSAHFIRCNNMYSKTFLSVPPDEPEVQCEDGPHCIWLSNCVGEVAGHSQSASQDFIELLSNSSHSVPAQPSHTQLPPHHRDSWGRLAWPLCGEHNGSSVEHGIGQHDHHHHPRHPLLATTQLSRDTTDQRSFSLARLVPLQEKLSVSRWR